MIYVELWGGLGNRVLVINSAVFLAKQYNQELVLLWNNSVDVVCSFYDLFDEINYEKVKLIEYSLPYINPNGDLNVGRVIKQMQLKIKYKFSPVYKLKQKIANVYQLDSQLSDLDDIKDKIRNDEDVYIRSCMELMENSPNFLHVRNDINGEVDEIIENLFGKEEYVGVHIRRGDHRRCILESTDDLFCVAFEEEIKQEKRLFYLASDDDDVIKVFVEKYAPFVKNFDHSNRRYSKQGQIDALKEMLVLSRACILYGSRSSTYTQAAIKFSDHSIIRVEV